MLNFSTLGRNATLEDRAIYKKFDKVYDERLIMAEQLQYIWPDYDITVAGETGIDIVKKGCDKKSDHTRLWTKGSDNILW